MNSAENKKTLKNDPRRDAKLPEKKPKAVRQKKGSRTSPERPTPKQGNGKAAARRAPKSPTAPRPRPEKDQIITAVRISIHDWMESIDVPEPDSSKAITIYSQFFAKLDRVDEQCDRARGFVRWCKGTILLKLKPLESGKQGLLRHGEWQQFVKRHRLGDSSLYAYRRIAQEFSRREAMRLGYTEMRDQAVGQDDNDGQHEPKKDQPKPKPKSTPTPHPEHLTLDKLIDGLSKAKKSVRWFAEDFDKMPDAYQPAKEVLPRLANAVIDLTCMIQDAERTIQKVQALSALLQERMTNVQEQSTPG